MTPTGVAQRMIVLVFLLTLFPSLPAAAGDPYSISRRVADSGGNPSQGGIAVVAKLGSVVVKGEASDPASGAQMFRNGEMAGIMGAAAHNIGRWYADVDVEVLTRLCSVLGVGVGYILICEGRKTEMIYEHVMPQQQETIGQYCTRLRRVAGEAFGRTVTIRDVVSMAKDRGEVTFTESWLRRLETDELQSPETENLDALAAAYTRLIGAVVQRQWLYEKAGYETSALVSADGGDVKTVSLQAVVDNPDAHLLVWIVAELLKLPSGKGDVGSLAQMARRLLETRDPKQLPQAGVLFEDTVKDRTVRDCLKNLGF